MSKIKRKFEWKNIISFVLAGVLLVGAIAGLGALFNRDTKTISSTAFAVGGINAQGNYEKSDVSIYTKDMFECQGLTIEPDFEATGTFKVFYYDSNKNFMDSTVEFNSEEGVYTKGDTFGEAKYARIMITPDVPTDDDGNEVEDFKIRFYEVSGYANDYTITVDKKQEFSLYSDELDKKYDVVNINYIGHGNSTSSGFTANSASPFHWYGQVDLTDYTEMVIKLDEGYINGTVMVEDKAESNIMVYSADPLGYYGSMADLGYELLHTVDGYAYYSIDISELGDVRFSTTFGQAEGISVWVR